NRAVPRLSSSSAILLAIAGWQQPNEIGAGKDCREQASRFEGVRAVGQHARLHVAMSEAATSNSKCVVSLWPYSSCASTRACQVPGGSWAGRGARQMCEDAVARIHGFCSPG